MATYPQGGDVPAMWRRSRYVATFPLCGDVPARRRRTRYLAAYPLGGDVPARLVATYPPARWRRTYLLGGDVRTG